MAQTSWPAAPKTPEEQLYEYQHTPPPPPPSYAKGPGRWLGNQWISYDVMPDFPDYPKESGSTTKPPPTDLAPAPPPPETQAAPPTESRGGDSGGSSVPGHTAPPAASVSDVYQNLMQQLLGSSGPAYSGGSSITAPVRPTSTLVAPTPVTVTGEKLNLPPKSEFDQLVHDQIVKMLGGPTAEEAGAAAANSVPVNAYRQSIMRDLDRSRAGAAEQAGISGTASSGGFGGTVQALQQAAGESTAKFTGDYVERAMTARRLELQQAMEMAQRQGQFEDAQSLQAEITRLDNQLRAQANANALYNTQSQLYLGQLGHEEDVYKTDVSKYGTELDADIRHEQNANQRYATEIQKLLGLSDVELRKYLGEMSNATSRYGIDVGAGTAADRLGFDYADANVKSDQWYIDRGLNPPK